MADDNYEYEESKSNFFSKINFGFLKTRSGKFVALGVAGVIAIGASVIASAAGTSVRHGLTVKEAEHLRANGYYGVKWVNGQYVPDFHNGFHRPTKPRKPSPGASQDHPLGPPAPHFPDPQQGHPTGHPSPNAPTAKPGHAK